MGESSNLEQNPACLGFSGPRVVCDPLRLPSFGAQGRRLGHMHLSPGFLLGGLCPLLAHTDTEVLPSGCHRPGAPTSSRFLSSPTVTLPPTGRLHPQNRPADALALRVWLLTRGQKLLTWRQETRGPSETSKPQTTPRRGDAPQHR